MSHNTVVQTEIRDLDALRSACQELGVELVQNAKARAYYAERSIPGEYVIRLKGPHDVALNRAQEGGFSLTCDWYGGHVEREVGSNFGKLLQMYGVCKATREARKKGYTVRRQTLGDGAVRLQIQGA